MKNAREIAMILISRYNKITQSEFGSSELKLQKLMYLAQRQSLALTGTPLFKEEFEGWIHGPVLKELRFFFDFSFETTKKEANETEKYIIDAIINEYGSFAPWALRELTHDEVSWKNSRIGLDDSNYGDRPIKLEDIYEDAKKIRIYDHSYDMHLDEFEDFSEEVFE